MQPDLVKFPIIQPEGHQKPDQDPELALGTGVRPLSTVAFSLLYVGLCRILGLIASFRRTESNRDIEIMVLRHQVRILERQLHARVRYRPCRSGDPGRVQPVAASSPVAVLSGHLLGTNIGRNV